MAKEGLEKKLQHVQELKSEKYVGTKEAWTYLSRIGEIYDSPTRIAEEINSELRSRGEVYVPATRDMILALGETASAYLEIIKNRLYKEGADLAELEDRGELDAYENLKLHPLCDMQNDLTTSEGIKRITDFLLPAYLSSQEEGATYNTFVDNVLGSMEDLNLLGKDEKSIFETMNISEWDLESTSKIAKLSEKRIRKRIYSQEFGEFDILDRMFRDKVEQKQEYRRELITDRIDRKLANEEEVTYESLRDQARKHVEHSSKTKEDLVSSNAPSFMIKKQDNVIKRHEHFYNIILRDQQFIEKYLDS